jgi:hypothetical protein
VGKTKSETGLSMFSRRTFSTILFITIHYSRAWTPPAISFMDTVFAYIVIFVNRACQRPSVWVYRIIRSRLAGHQVMVI